MQQPAMPSMQVICLLLHIFLNLTCVTAMTAEQHEAVMDLRDSPGPDDSDWEMLDDILHGDAALGISHEGGEFEALNELRGNVNETYVLYFMTLA